jgi:riboflavin kinase/FMN adenylyltransferase
VVTFDPHPLTVVAPEHAPRLLVGIEHRLELLADAGLDVAAVISFDAAMRRRTAASFAAAVLAGALHARLVVVGEDFRFGHQRTGNVASLAELGDVHGFTTEIVPLVGGQAPMSSTRVRGLVAAGDLAGVAEALGRPHEVRGPVVAGEGRGRLLGFPTANVAVPAGLALPPAGVYAVRAGPSGGALVPAVANLGTRPTFGGPGEETLEVHLLEPAGDLYGRVLRVAFVARLRDERRFGGPEDLAAQIGADVAAARAVLGG